MSTDSSQHPQTQEAIDAQAADWLLRAEEGLSAGQADEFAHWQRADPRHARAVARLQKTMSLLDRVPELEATGRGIPTRSRGRRGWWSGAAAAGLAAAAAGFIFLQPAPPRAEPPPVETTYATTATGYQRVGLEDGSVVELNGASEVRVKFTPTTREVTLVRGEALFSVAQQPSRPFVVTAQHVSVRAVGTAFVVRYQGLDIEVLVTEGKVDVGPPAAVAEAAPHRAVVRVGAGEHVTVRPDETGAVAPAVEKVAPAAQLSSLDWQAPHLVFVDKPLREVAAEFNRRNRVQLEIRDEALAARAVGGNFRPDNVEAFVRLLEGNGDIAVERPAPDRIVLRRAK